MNVLDGPDNPLPRRRRRLDRVMMTLMTLLTAVGVFWVVWILLTALERGFEAFSPDLFLKDTPPPGVAGGGLRNAFVGSLELLAVALAIGTPVGLLAGTWLGEFARRHPAAGATVRFLNDILLSAPSIVIGLFAYTLLVAPLKHFSALAGGVALALIMIPVVVRTTDEMLRLVPDALREAAVALGIPYWRMVVHISWKAASRGILTGILLALARLSGETAPLLFTALNSPYFSTALDKPIASLPVAIFQFAMSPYPDWQKLAWAGAFVAMVFILSLGLLARWLQARGTPST